MKGSGLFHLLSFLLLVIYATAWPWPDSFKDLDGLVIPRQNAATSGMFDLVDEAGFNS
jgi:hypothetical protein